MVKFGEHGDGERDLDSDDGLAYDGASGVLSFRESNSLRLREDRKALPLEDGTRSPMCIARCKTFVRKARTTAVTYPSIWKNGAPF